MENSEYRPKDEIEKTRDIFIESFKERMELLVLDVFNQDVPSDLLNAKVFANISALALTMIKDYERDIEEQLELIKQNPHLVFRDEVIKLIENELEQAVNIIIDHISSWTRTLTDQEYIYVRDLLLNSQVELLNTTFKSLNSTMKGKISEEEKYQFKLLTAEIPASEVKRRTKNYQQAFKDLEELRLIVDANTFYTERHRLFEHNLEKFLTLVLKQKGFIPDSFINGFDVGAALNFYLKSIGVLLSALGTVCLLFSSIGEAESDVFLKNFAMLCFLIVGLEVMALTLNSESKKYQVKQYEKKLSKNINQFPSVVMGEASKKKIEENGEELLQDDDDQNGSLFLDPNDSKFNLEG